MWFSKKEDVDEMIKTQLTFIGILSIYCGNKQKNKRKKNYSCNLAVHNNNNNYNNLRNKLEWMLEWIYRIDSLIN